MKPKPKARLVVYILLLFIMANIAVTAYFLWPVVETEFFSTASFTVIPTTIATEIPVEIPTITPSSTELLPTESFTETPNPTATQIPPTLTPTVPSANFMGMVENGIIILSLADGHYFHLFAYHPQYLPLLRLTNDEADDIHPAISPDGTKIAFSSRRNGYWDLFILDLATSQIVQMTSTPHYEGSPTWSPDGQWVAFESNVNGNMDVYLLEVPHPENPPLQLTDDPSTDHSPCWMPGENGRQIAFVSDRSGESEIWLARLDNFKERFINISLDADSKDTHPVWSPDGQMIAWAKNAMGDHALVIWNINNPNEPPKPAGTGDWPVWSPDGTSLFTYVKHPNLNAIASYETINGLINIPLIRMPGPIHGLDWKKGSLPDLLSTRMGEAPSPLPEPLWRSVLINDPMPEGTNGLVSLDGVSAPSPMLLDSIDDSYSTLRYQIGDQIGWDFLNSLENAFVDKETPSDPGTTYSWLNTGRGISVNELPLNSGWMVLVKEEFGNQIYWRVLLKTRNQDGSQGRPITDRIWDITARNSGDPTVYEKGGKEKNAPEGYWIDFTEWAGRYNWDRVPALSNWVTYYQGARFGMFAHTEELDLKTAMERMYPGEPFSWITVRSTITPLPTPKPPNPTSTPVTIE